jgi:membrane-bound lytic murein transglycosylase F
LNKIIVLILIIFSSFASCIRESGSDPEVIEVSRDLDAIIASGKIRAVTNVNQASYFIYKGEPMGFNFEMLRRFADHLDLELEIIPENDIDEAYQMIRCGKADILAMGLTINSERKELMKFTTPILETRQVLVQRKPDSWRTMKTHEIDRELIRNQLDLEGKSVYIQKGSSYKQSLLALEQESGGNVEIIEAPFDSEDLARQVSRGEINLTICDENMASLLASLYPNLDFLTPVSFPQKQAWSVRKEGSDMLLKEIDNWLTRFTTSNEFAFMQAKYFKDRRMQLIAGSEFLSFNTGRVSPYDELIKRYSETIGWDWRLIAALIYQESRFDPSVESGSGAYGLMQVMPSTGDHFGLDVTKSVDNNIHAGVCYIKYLSGFFNDKIPDNDERVKFVLASYNAGQGHILDAMKLATKNGFDPKKWDNNVALFLAKKSEQAYYTDPVVKYGSLRGAAVNSYVKEILERYDHYKNVK